MSEQVKRFWHYEMDGEQHARTFYAVRPDPVAVCGVERRDFDTAKAAIIFVHRENDVLRRTP